MTQPDPIHTNAPMWSYTCAAGRYWETSLVRLCWAIFTHRLWHWRRGDGWVD